jgi:hypothetical protein
VHKRQSVKWEMKDGHEGSDKAVGKGEISTLLTGVAHVPGALANGARVQMWPTL